jgi:hypothetical protein
MPQPSSECLTLHRTYLYTTPERRSVFTQFRVFPISTSVDITVYQYGKNVLYLFYKIAQRNIKREIFQRFRVDIELYKHGS